MKKEFELDEDIYISAKNIIQNSGLDIEKTINIFLKRIVKEDSISFLFNKSNALSVSNRNFENYNQDCRMTKSIAKRLFMNEGYAFRGKCVFASENSSTHIFWANIHYSILSQDWTLILNDKSRKKMYLLLIPANTFSFSDLVMRADKPEIIDLQIAYNDPTFTDNRSGIAFNSYIVKTLNY